VYNLYYTFPNFVMEIVIVVYVIKDPTIVRN
jgi:hypothetical protein